MYNDIVPEDKTWTTGTSSLNRMISLISNMQQTRKFQLEEQSKVLRVKGRIAIQAIDDALGAINLGSGPVEKSGSTKPDIGKTAVTFPFLDFGYTASKLKDLLMGTDPDSRYELDLIRLQIQGFTTSWDFYKSIPIYSPPIVSLNVGAELTPYIRPTILGYDLTGLGGLLRPVS